MPKKSYKDDQRQRSATCCKDCCSLSFNFSRPSLGLGLMRLYLNSQKQGENLNDSLMNDSKKPRLSFLPGMK